MQTSILARLGTTRRIGTSDLPIGGGRDFPIGAAQRSEWVKSAAEQEGADPARVDELLARYGTLARAILRKEASVPDQRLTDAPDYSTAEIEWLVRNEQVTHLDDIVMRRTTLAISGRLSRRDLRLIAEIASNALNWDELRQMMEIERTTVMLSKRNRIKFVNEGKYESLTIVSCQNAANRITNFERPGRHHAACSPRQLRQHR